MLQASLEAPTLLVAMPQVQDPFFHRGVVLLVNHNHDGSFGFVVNRSTDLLVAKVLEELEIPWNGQPSEAALLGGPVRPQLGTILLPTLATNLFGEELALEIAPGISITQDLGVLQTLAESPPAGLRLILGYSGWSPGQLNGEVERHDWLVCPVDPDLIFSQRVDSLWEGSLRLMGINSKDLPEWTLPSENIN